MKKISFALLIFLNCFCLFAGDFSRLSFPTDEEIKDMISQASQEDACDGEEVYDLLPQEYQQLAVQQDPYLVKFFLERKGCAPEEWFLGANVNDVRVVLLGKYARGVVIFFRLIKDATVENHILPMMNQVIDSFPNK